MRIFLFICASLLSTSLALELAVSNGDTKKYTTPDLPISGWDNNFDVQNVQVFIPSDSTGCDVKELAGAAGMAVLAINDGCSPSQHIKNAWEAKAAALILIFQKASAPAGASFTWASQDISASDGIKLPTVEISQPDGNEMLDLIEQYPLSQVHIMDGDTNVWIPVFRGGAMIFWQVALSFAFFVPLVLAYYKLVVLIMRWKESSLLWAFFNTQTFIIYSVITASSFCFAYIAVDPLHTRGIYNNLTDAIFATLGLPPTLTGTFLITVIWLTGFNNTAVISRKELVVKISKVFLGIMIFFFLLDLIFSFVRGTYQGSSSISTIIGVYYILAALAISIFYIVIAVRIKRKIKNISQEVSNKSSSTLPKFAKLVNRNMWLFAVFYGLWVISAAVNTTSMSWQPQGRLGIYFFTYLFIAVINIIHILMVSTPGSAGPSSSGITESGTVHSSEFSKSTKSAASMRDDE